ncbi:Nucleotidyltransferase [Lentzea albidocapillata subsp. violacea]|uniref:Nucleotidyltransferase n=1 Tax=Lentzea albidocapillata subsp. violacea TaxID=128104 RepID=A0A1G9GAA2_9PSEU|nr:GSU2403 family nucleotidyltransferase fold protein [Lentzea albidocapillata]SDK97495.1 Nucleotidyltransferase [Lentzea albidocapillata subsp. violacea]
MISPEYVQARAVLLDALDGLGTHREAVVLVGAQAVYLHAGAADFATAPTTTDADLAFIPNLLASEPAVVDAMRAAGFVPGNQPGSWLGRGGIAVDLMAPEALCGGSSSHRSARLQPPHDDKMTARRTAGLEAAVVDNDVRTIRALDAGDSRSFEIKVAGPAALIVSKVIKIAERRHQQPHRLKPKDGLDVLRLLRAEEDFRALARSLRDLVSNELSGVVAKQAAEELRVLAAEPDGLLPKLAAEAEGIFGDSDEIRISMVALVDELLREFDRMIQEWPPDTSELAEGSAEPR